MDEQELTQAFDALRTMASERDLGWVLERVDEELSGGVTIELSEPVAVKLPQNKRSTHVTSGSMNRPFSSQERLVVMIDALRRAVVLPVLLENDIVDQVRSLRLDDAEPDRVVEVSIGGIDEAAGGRRVLGAVDRLADARRLNDALERLKSEATVDAS